MKSSKTTQLSLRDAEQILDKWINELHDFDPEDQSSYKKAAVVQQNFDRLSKAIDQKFKFEFFRQRQLEVTHVSDHVRQLPKKE